VLTVTAVQVLDEMLGVDGSEAHPAVLIIGIGNDGREDGLDRASDLVCARHRELTVLEGWSEDRRDLWVFDNFGRDGDRHTLAAVGRRGFVIV